MADLAVALHNPLGRGQLCQTHRAAGVQLLGRDADLSAEPELPAVGEPGRGVDHDGCRIHLRGPATGSATVLGDDCLSVAGAVPLDMGQRLVERVDDPRADVQREVLAAKSSSVARV